MNTAIIAYRIFRSARGWLEASDLLLLKLREAAYVHRLTDSKQVSFGQSDVSIQTLKSLKLEFLSTAGQYPLVKDLLKVTCAAGTLFPVSNISIEGLQGILKM